MSNPYEKETWADHATMLVFIAPVLVFLIMISPFIAAINIIKHAKYKT